MKSQRGDRHETINQRKQTTRVRETESGGADREREREREQQTNIHRNARPQEKHNNTTKVSPCLSLSRFLYLSRSLSSLSLSLSRCFFLSIDFPSAPRADITISSDSTRHHVYENRNAPQTQNSANITNTVAITISKVRDMVGAHFWSYPPQP